MAYELNSSKPILQVSDTILFNVDNVNSFGMNIISSFFFIVSFDIIYLLYIFCSIGFIFFDIKAPFDISQLYKLLYPSEYHYIYAIIKIKKISKENLFIYNIIKR